MPPPSSNALLDGISTVSRGMHSGVSPRLLPADQVAFAVNCTFRNGLPRTRPVFRRVTLTYTDATVQTNATKKLFQGAGFHQAYGNGENCLVASIGGRLFKYAVATTGAVQDISVLSQTITLVDMGGGFTVPAVGTNVSVTVDSTVGFTAGLPVVILGKNYGVFSVTSGTVALLVNIDDTPGTVIPNNTPIKTRDDLNSPVNPDCWMWQAEDFLIIQNGQKDPLFFDGAKVRRSLGMGGSELPVGCMGAYVQGRNWMVLAGTPSQKPSQQFMAGDLTYSHGYNDGYGGRAGCLRIEENSMFSGGGAFSVPVAAGSITAMSSVAIADSSLGQGPLQVFTQTAVFSVQVPLDRTEWAATQYPLMTVGLPNYGAVGALAVAPVNGDLWYRSLDGIRSYQIARRDFNTFVNTPLSVEVERILRLDTERLLSKASVVLFDNRWLGTCFPQFVRGRGTMHRGLVALDFNNVSNLTTRSNPAYDGLWTGLNILQLVKGVFSGVERCFAFALDCNADIVLYEVLKDGAGQFDHDGTDDVAVESFFESKSMGWKDGGNVLKKLLCGDLYLDKLAGPGTGTVEFDFKYRSDEDPFWATWHSFNLCAPLKDCSTADCPTFADVKEQYRTYLRLPDPSEQCSSITHRMRRTGYEFQIRMWVKGAWQLNRLHLWAAQISDSVVTGCPTSQTCTLVPCAGEGTEGLPGEPGVPTEDVCYGITMEGYTPYIVNESGVVIRTEDQVDCPPGTPVGDGTIPVTPPPTPSLPTWPVPGALCVGSQFWGPCTFQDTVVPNDTKWVAINCGAFDPVTYVATNGAPGCLAAWCAETWTQFLAYATANNIAWTQARFVWANVNLTGWMGTQVFPSRTGPFNEVVLLTQTVEVEFCV